MEFSRPYCIFILLAFNTVWSYAQTPFSQLKDVCKPEAELHVLVFLDPECPISQKYTHTLNELSSQFENAGVRFHAIFSVQRITTPEISEFMRVYSLKLKSLCDSTLAVASSLGATVTPEAFLLTKDLRVIYSGAIDDWYYDLGKATRKTRTPYLRQAIDSYFQNKPIDRNRTEPVGCKISYTKLETP